MNIGEKVILCYYGKEIMAGIITQFDGENHHFENQIHKQIIPLDDVAFEVRKPFDMQEYNYLTSLQLSNSLFNLMRQIRYKEVLYNDSELQKKVVELHSLLTDVL